jgi:mycothiol synthase
MATRSMDNRIPWQKRPYLTQADLQAMCDLLAAGRRAANGCYYVHTGDLSWWLGYPPNESARRENITLWETPEGELAAWVLLDPEWGTFDVFIHPDWFAHPAAGDLVAWAAEQAARRVSASAEAAIRTMWIAEDDTISIERLNRLGFRCIERYSQLCQRQLGSQPLPEPQLPPGFLARPVAGTQEAKLRAAASHAAFESSLPFEAYWPRYLRFMQSALYPTGSDLVIEAQDGQIAAFCICWLDSLNRVGLFEPVGVHPEFQRRGLGKAILQEGLRRMQAGGMESAIVGTGYDNTPALNLYQATEFEFSLRLLTFEKDNQESRS